MYMAGRRRREASLGGMRGLLWCVLLVVGLVGSVVVAAPAGAAPVGSSAAEADVLPVFSACVGDATRDAGFVDTGGLVAEAAINCIAYYGITRGRTSERFDAGSEVTRSQMALFLYRAAGVAGVDLTGGSGAADFADIAGLDEERRDAIVALARNDILVGSEMAFKAGCEHHAC